jgi:hypothetical protein
MLALALQLAFKGLQPGGRRDYFEDWHTKTPLNNEQTLKTTKDGNVKQVLFREGTSRRGGK